MTAADASSRWDAIGRSMRERLARHTPRALTRYPFEVLAAVTAILVGLPLLFGVAAPTSLSLLLPTLAYLAYAVALVLGGLTVSAGLHYRHVMVLAAGLQLLSGSFIIYAIAVVGLAGWAAAWNVFGAYLCLGLVSFARAVHFRRLVDIEEGARALREPSS